MDKIKPLMKKIMFSLILLFPVFFLLAQRDHGRSLVGVTAGGSFATNLYDYGEYGGEPPMGFHLLPAGGLTFDFESKRSFSFYMALNFKGKGDKIGMADYVSGWTFPQEEGNTITAEADGSISTSHYWVEFPLAFTFNFGQTSRVQIGAGAFGAYGLFGKEKRDFAITYYLNDEFLIDETVKEDMDLDMVSFVVENEEEGHRYINRVDYGLFFLLGFKMHPLAITASASWGFANQLPLLGSDLFTAQKSVKEIHSLTPALTVTYFFTK